MKGLKDLQQAAKERKISAELLKDEKFQEKLKELVEKETGNEITREQVAEIIKNFEIILQNEKLLNDVELENVSGGKEELEAQDANTKGKKAVRSICNMLVKVILYSVGSRVGG